MPRKKKVEPETEMGLGLTEFPPESTVKPETSKTIPKETGGGARVSEEAPALTLEQESEARRQIDEMATVLGVKALAEAVRQNRETLNQLLERPEHNPAAVLDQVFEKYPMFKSLAEEILREIPGILKGLAGQTPVSEEFKKHYEESQKAYLARRESVITELERLLMEGKELKVVEG